MSGFRKIASSIPIFTLFLLILLFPASVWGTEGVRELSGYGNKKVTDLYLQEGIVIVEVNWQKPWAITLSLHEKGGGGGRSILERGPLENKYYLHVPKDNLYYLTVTSRGPWKVRVSQLQASEGTPPPVAFHGQGSQLSPVMLLNSGPASFRVTKSKAGRYRVVTTLINIGHYPVPIDAGMFIDTDPAGTNVKTVSIPKPGFYILQVESEGNWRVEVEQSEDSSL